VGEGRGEGGEKAAGDEPVNLVHVLLGARAAVDAGRAVEVHDADDGHQRGADEERPVEALADAEVIAADHHGFLLDAGTTGPVRDALVRAAGRVASRRWHSPPTS